MVFKKNCRIALAGVQFIAARTYLGVWPVPLTHVLVGGLFLLLSLVSSFAGGPKYVAGVSYFNQGLAGTPLTWAEPQGPISYYTDQGNLSAFVSGASADALVAEAWNQWASIPTAAVAVVRAGQLAEDVIGPSSGGTFTFPADISPGATGTPIGIVYDADGSVTDALMGAGAGSAESCFTNAAYGEVDNFGVDAHFHHALVVINGNCAQNSSQLPDVEYRLVRVFGRALGLDWSQLNLNVITGLPVRPTSDDYNGFPVMHESDSANCVPISLCYSNNNQTNPFLPKMDDRAALTRLYPVTQQNLGSFPGKEISSQVTARIFGNVYFGSASGQIVQPMQGVNVVARRIDPLTGLPSGVFAETSISGFLFSGNAGNIISGFNDANGRPFSDYGATDSAVQGFFDLSGLQIPNGSLSAQYQLGVETVDPLYSENVGPYAPLQVTPSRTFEPIVVTVTLGGETRQDVVMQGSAVADANWYGATTYSAPGALPSSGNWAGTLNAFGETDYFWFNAQGNRTLSVMVKPIDEGSTATLNKLQPVAGMWALANPGTSPAPASTPSSFNTTVFAETRLDATILQSTAFRLGIADYRGDGRPDYRYRARVFYGDNVFPARASVLGNTPIAIQGLGFLTPTTVSIGSAIAPLAAITAGQMLINAPPMKDGVQDVVLADASTGASSTMTGVLTYGAAPTDVIVMLPDQNPRVPVGGQSSNPVGVKVFRADGTTPVAGATVTFTSVPAVGFSTCGGAPSCTAVTDQSGEASSRVTILLPGITTVTAQLAKDSYAIAKQVQTTIVGISTPLDISLSSTLVSIAQGGTLTLPITSRVLSNGSPLSGRSVNYFNNNGSGTLSSSTAVTDANGFATANLQLSSFSSEESVSVCVAPNNVPCQTWTRSQSPWLRFN